MTNEFIRQYCSSCEFSIYEGWDGTPSLPNYCGVIDEGGCCSEKIKTAKRCRKGLLDIPYIPKYVAGERLHYLHGDEVVQILEVSNDKYLYRREGLQGKFDEPYPPETMLAEDFDEWYTTMEDYEELYPD